MPGGIINPKGRKNLDSTSRDLTPKYSDENDIQLGLTKDLVTKTPYKRPFAGIKSSEDRQEIQREVSRLKRMHKKKSAIIILLKDKFDFNDVEAQNLYSKATTNWSNSNKSKKKKKGKNKAKKRRKR